MNRWIVLALVLVLGSVTSCVPTVLEGSGNPATEQREVSGVSSVALAGMGSLVIRQTDTEALSVTADDNLLEHVRTEVRDGRLVIDLDPRTPGVVVRPRTPLVFELDVVDIESVAISGSGSVAADTLRAEEMSIAVSGSGDVRIGSLEVGNVDVAIAGSGDVVLAGRAPSQSVAVSGSGRYSASELASSRVVIGVSGSGDATVWAADTLDISISGSGTVAYHGDPDVTKRVSGSGRIRELGPRRATL